MKKIILSGGGTGGHIYPAVAVAEALKARYGDDVELLFVGAEGRMEMEKVPALGYKIEGLPIAGLQRRLDWRNIQVPFKLMKSISRAKRIIKSFEADVVVGFGGYASAPVLWAAQKCGVPTIIQEQNSYAGLTNKILGGKVKKVCAAYDNMEKFFAAEKIVLTGNPLRGNFSEVSKCRAVALKYFGFDESLPVVLVVGGSLGARTFNNMMKTWVESLGGKAPKFQVIWQTGKYYQTEMTKFLAENPTPNIWQGAFLERMDYAYGAADIVISRSGACTISELCEVGRPTIFVPSPNVSEDHQTKNAQALVNKDAALMVADKDANADCMALVGKTLGNQELMGSLSKNIKAMAFKDSASRIVDVIEEVINNGI
ncbi:MAG: undecaprenyldiphospho-muramoylpentapeptide beta-N-acetylglucosaminyltransferase [Rikenellaceae bacterium]